MLKNRNKTKPQTVDYEHLGKMLDNIYQTGYIDRNQAYKMSFIKGLVSGFGGVLGATLLVALLLWIISLLGHVPFLQPISDNIENTLQQER